MGQTCLSGGGYEPGQLHGANTIIVVVVEKVERENSAYEAEFKHVCP